MRGIFGMPTFREPCSPLHQQEQRRAAWYTARMDLDTEETREMHNLYIESIRNLTNIIIIILKFFIFWLTYGLGLNWSHLNWW